MDVNIGETNKLKKQKQIIIIFFPPYGQFSRVPVELILIRAPDESNQRDDMKCPWANPIFLCRIDSTPFCYVISL
jgi:hypothetical protein